MLFVGEGWGLGDGVGRATNDCDGVLVEQEEEEESDGADSFVVVVVVVVVVGNRSLKIGIFVPGLRDLF